MTTGIVPSFGRPGIGSAQVAQRRNVSRNGALDYYPAGGVIKGASARDPGNSAYSTRALRAGLLLGKITSGGYYANSIYGLTNGALTSAGTTVTVAAAVVTELVRRVGASGTFKLTGPPTAAGVVRTATVTYSAASGTSITITAIGVNEVQTVAFAIASTGGSIALELYDPRNNSYVKVEAAAWSATDATYLSNIQAKLDLAFGAANVVVVSAQSATDTDSALVFTYSGATVAALPVVDGSGTAKLPIVTTLPTSSTSYTVARTTAGVDGRFVTQSLVQPTDGSETIRTVVPDGYGLVIPDDDSDIDFPMIPIAGTLDVGQIIDYPADASLKAYVRQSLSTLSGGKWIFSDQF